MSPIEELREKAIQARNLAYNPYSQFAVGAAIRTNLKKVFTGCNIENSSFGATVCAERVAIFTAVAQGVLPTDRIKEVYVVTESDPPCAPCGICRQVISEFADPKCLIHVANTQGEHRTYIFNELLPDAFTPIHLESGKRPFLKKNEKSRKSK